MPKSFVGKEKFCVVMGDFNINIIKKPQNPLTNSVVIGIYLYDYTVFNIINKLKLEITYVNMSYINNNTLTYAKLDSQWLYTGNFNSLYEANCILLKKK